MAQSNRMRASQFSRHRMAYLSLSLPCGRSRQVLRFALRRTVTMRTMASVLALDACSISRPLFSLLVNSGMATVITLAILVSMLEVPAHSSDRFADRTKHRLLSHRQRSGCHHMDFDRPAMGGWRRIDHDFQFQSRFYADPPRKYGQHCQYWQLLLPSSLIMMLTAHSNGYREGTTTIFFS